METLWFVLVAFMLVAYAALDGFDIGVGIIHHFVARDEVERSLTLRAIGPVFLDGHESKTPPSAQILSQDTGA